MNNSRSCDRTLGDRGALERDRCLALIRLQVLIQSIKLRERRIIQISIHLDETGDFCQCGLNLLITARSVRLRISTAAVSQLISGVYKAVSNFRRRIALQCLLQLARHK